MTPFFLLGASDPEMDKIEELLKAAEEKYAYASKAGKRVTTATAYDADEVNLASSSYLVTVECHPASPDPVVVIDHHRDGDPGYDLGPENFLLGSSIGQWLLFMIMERLERFRKLDFPETAPKGATGFYFENERWRIEADGVAFVLPDSIVYTAATDHCPLDAYAGRCKGIDHNSFFHYRLKQISEKNSVSYQEVLRLVNRYKKHFKRHRPLIDLTHIPLGPEAYSVKYLVLRELALHTQRATALQISEEHGEKLMLVGIDPLSVKKLLRERRFKGKKLKNVFGVPSRGYAGGFIDIPHYIRPLMKRFEIHCAISDIINERRRSE